MNCIFSKWITLLALILTSTLIAKAAALDGGDSSISGKVTKFDGVTPLGAIHVAAFGLQETSEGFAWSMTGSSLTRSNGIYTISDLPSGSYKLRFYDSDGQYLTQYYNNVADIFSGENITVGESSVITGINASLVVGGKITGTVTGPNGTSPLGGIEVIAYYWDRNDEEWNWVDSTNTSANGSYTITGLAAGDYRIRFTDNAGNYLTEFHDNAATLGAAADITVLESLTVPNINASLAAAGKITGTITNSSGITPLKDIDVNVYGWDEEDGEWDWLTSSRTAVTGVYTIGGLPSGDYRIEFYDESENYRDEYYNNAASLYSAQDITVTAPATVTGINASLVERGKITGIVTAPDGVTPLENIEVRAYYWDENNEDWEWDSYTTSTADGSYTISGLDAKNYRVRFYDYNGNYLTEYYNNATSLDSAGNIAVGPSATVPGINASLTAAGKIAGTITALDGVTPLPGISVNAYQWNEDYEEWDEVRGGVTDEGGHYIVGGLPTGSYRIAFDDEDANYRSEYYNDATEIETADEIEVTVGNTSAGIDASLAERGKISGKITAADGVTPLSGITVYAYYWEEDWED